MKYLRLFQNRESALGETFTSIVFYLNGAPKPMFAGKEWGDTCTIVIDDTEGSAGIKPKGLTIIFRDDEGNIISEKEYISGETIIIPEAPVKEGYTFLGWGDVVIDKAVTNMTFIAQYEITPKVTITMSDSYTDSSSIALNATKTETVTGELSFTTDLASDIAHIVDNALIFDKHYEGSVTVTASALDKHSNIQSDSKTITVSCNVADTVECVVNNVTADDVDADATSAIIKYDCNVTTTTHAGVSNTVVTHKEKTVTFEANETEEDVTRSGSFACEHGETVEWSVIQHGNETSNPKDNQIWYKTNDDVVIVPQNMSPTTNKYTTKGVMTFDDNVTSIAQSAFKSKSTLTEFYGGMSLTSVGSYAFCACKSLTSIDLPNCSYVGSSAFANCSSLTSINLPKCTTVGNDAFNACKGLTSVNLPNCTYVASYAFCNCTSLTSIDLPNCTNVANCAFTVCTSLPSIDLPKCTTVGSNAFANCSKLTSVNLPKCTNVSHSAFVNCSSLTSVNLQNCPSVGSCTFQNCSSLTSINLPNCSYVGSSAFANCSSLTSIDLPKCTTVTDDAFENCSSLTSISLPNCSYVKRRAFKYCTSLTSIDLPNCSSVAGYAFQRCSSLTSVSLPNCTYVASYAFCNCTSLTSIDLPNCTNVANCAFTVCTSLPSIDLPKCTTVGSNAFENCSSLTSIDLPNCTSVGNCAFYNCTSLSKFTGLLATEDNRCLMSNGTIYAFAPCGLTSYAREDCTTVGNAAFQRCTSLASIDLPNCTTIGYSAFQHCYSLTSIDLPNCTSIGGWAFQFCSNLTTVTLGASTMCSLGNNAAFSYCSKLTSIYVTPSLVDAYKADLVWSWYSSKIVSIV